MSVERINEATPVAEHELALRRYIDALLFEPETEHSENMLETRSDMKHQQSGSVVKKEILPLLWVSDDAENTQNVTKNEKTFECLMFKMAGFLDLAIPLARLNGIMPWNGELTDTTGQTDWFLGTFLSRGKQVKVIDLARFLIPENHMSRQVVESERHFKHLLLFDSGRMGLVCDELGKVLKLSEENIHWRQDRSSRPWLAGTLIEQMSTLIDIGRITKIFNQRAPGDTR